MIAEDQGQGMTKEYFFLRNYTEETVNHLKYFKIIEVSW